MYLPIKGFFAILISIIFIAGITTIIPSQERFGKTEKETIGDSLFVYGTRGERPRYESITSPYTQEEGVMLNDISLPELLKTPSKASGFIPEKIEVSSEVVSALKDYGNETGEIVRTHFDGSRDEVAILRLYVTEPNNVQAEKELVALSDEYAKVSGELYIVHPPAPIAEAHKNYADAHRNIGENLKMLMSSEFSIEKVSSYNDSVASFVDAYLSVAQTLRAYGVVFGTSEPGNLFTLPF